MLDCRAPARAAQCFRIATHPVRIAHVKRLSIAVSRMAQDGAAICELCHVFTGDIVKPEAVAGKPVDGLAGRPRVAPGITKSCGSSGGQSRFIVCQVQGGERVVASERHLTTFCWIGNGICAVDGAFDAHRHRQFSRNTAA